VLRMDRDPRDLLAPRGSVDSNAGSVHAQQDDRLVPRDVDLARYQVAQVASIEDRVSFDREQGRVEDYETDQGPQRFTTSRRGTVEDERGSTTTTVVRLAAQQELEHKQHLDRMRVDLARKEWATEQQQRAELDYARAHHPHSAHHHSLNQQLVRVVTTANGTPATVVQVTRGGIGSDEFVEQRRLEAIQEEQILTTDHHQTHQQHIQLQPQHVVEEQQHALELLTVQHPDIQTQEMIVDGDTVYQQIKRPEQHKVNLKVGVNGELIVVTGELVGEPMVAHLHTTQHVLQPNIKHQTREEMATVVSEAGSSGTVTAIGVDEPELKYIAPTTAQLAVTPPLPALVQRPPNTVAQEVSVPAGPPALVNLKKPVFFEELHELYRTDLHTDTILRCRDGEKRAHSIVLGAASSLFRFMFAEIATKILDSEYIVSLPDLTLQELEGLLKPMYGFGSEVEDAIVKTDCMGVKVDFNEGGIYEAKLREAQRENLRNGREEYGLIPENQIKQEKKSRDKMSYDGLNASSDDEDYRPKTKTKHGYKYDSFVEDTSSSDSESDYDDDELVDDAKPRKRARKKATKSTRKYTKRIKSEPLICVKEEAIDKTFDEFNEMFLQKTQVTRNAEIKFAQDHIGFYHCQEEGCSFKTMVRPSVHQHHKFTHQNLHGYQEALLGCASCGESWVNQIYYRKHIESNECKGPNPKIPYVCENCGQGWYNLTNYTKHAEARECKTNTSHSGKKPCSNDGCPLTFFSDTNRQTHETRAHKPITAGTMYRCAKCNINFINHKDYNKHKKDVHHEKPRGGFVVYVCKVIGCEYTNPDRKVFETHVREDHPDECFLCDLCGRNFSDALKLEQHKENNPNGRGGKRCLPVNYNCPHCPREFNRKRHMELHVLFKHTQERPFGCDQCGKRFKTRQCVRLHMRSHGVGGYGGCCEECGKTFNQISAYHTHLKVHSNVRDFACEDCGMTFKLKHSLKKHQLVHKPEFGHTCDFCGKKFKRSDNLINHRRRHTGEHPYKCDKCNWTGPDSSSFIHHKKKHTDVVHNTQELKLIHAISKLPGHLLERDSMNGREAHNDII